jgi:hypothetical protein
VAKRNPDHDVKARIDRMQTVAHTGIKETLGNLKKIAEG